MTKHYRLVVAALAWMALGPQWLVAQTAVLSLMDARTGFRTNIIRDIREQTPADSPPPGRYMLIHYPSAAGGLAAYLTRNPHDGQRRPAVVWAHGGFGGIDRFFFADLPLDNEQSPKAFDEDAFTVMIPSWRGTSDNPGRQEFFYGEVDDLVAAVAYVKTLPYVDPNRVYVVGHSTGGTLALLAAEASNTIRAAFSFGAITDISSYLARPKPPVFPFDTNSPAEIRLRSAVNFVAALQTPTFCIEGSRSPNCKGFAALQAAADASRAPLRTYVIPYGTHFNILHSLTRVIADKIKSDTGPTCNIQISQDELTGAFNQFLDIEARDRTTPPVTLSDSMSAHMAVVATERGIDPSKMFLRVDLTADDKVFVRITPSIDTSYVVITAGSTHVALNPAANRAMAPIYVDFDQNTRKIIVTHPKTS